MNESPNLGEYIAVLRRRKKPIILVAGAVLFLAVLVALLWPPTYKTSATILIEEQEIPQDMVRSTITSYANQQIEVIRARVLTLQNIMQIVEKFGLYDADELERTPRTEIVQKFIDAVGLDLLSAEIIDPRSGRPTQATIAFTLSFEADTPTKALKVTNELANLFLNENLRSRTEKTSSTAEFLREEVRKSNAEVQHIEEQIAAYKAEHQAALPESFQLNMQNLTRYQSQLVANESRVQELAKRQAELETRLASTSKYAPIVLPSGEAVLSDVDRLKALQSQYTRVAARYSDNHPDVTRLRREIDALLTQIGGSGNRAELQRLLDSRKAELATLKGKYTADNPEVVAMQSIVTQLEDQLAESQDNENVPEPDNPAYLMLDNQLQSMRMEKDALLKQNKQLESQIEALNAAAAQAPTVEREYKNLLRNLEVTGTKNLDLKSKLQDAELAGELEAGRKGQRYTMVEPPALPEKPSSPNRIAILILGIFLAGVAGVGLGILLEAMDASIRSARKLGDLMGVAPLVSISYIQTPAEQVAASPNRRLYIALAAAVFLGIVGLLCIHFFVRPLDVLWYSQLNKLG